MPQRIDEILPISFPKSVKKRGKKLAGGADVYIANDRTLDGFVEDAGEELEVQVKISRAGLRFTCTCRPAGPCEHLAAVLRRAQLDDVMVEVGPRGGLTFRSEDAIDHVATSGLASDERQSSDVVSMAKELERAGLAPAEVEAIARDLEATLRSAAQSAPKPPPPKPVDPLAAPRRRIQALPAAARGADVWARAAMRTSIEVRYRIDAEETAWRDAIVLCIEHRQLTKTGRPGAWKAFSGSVDRLPGEEREVVASLHGAVAPQEVLHGAALTNARKRHALLPDAARVLLPKLAAKRMLWAGSAREATRVSWDEVTHVFGVKVHEVEDDTYRVDGFLARDGERIPIEEAVALTQAAVVLFADRVAPLDDRSALRLAQQLSADGGFDVPAALLGECCEKLIRCAGDALLDLPKYEIQSGDPAPILELLGSDGDVHVARVSFDYGDRRVPAAMGPGSFERGETLVCRDRAREADWLATMLESGASHAKSDPQDIVRIDGKRLTKVLGKLAARDVRMEASAVDIRVPKNIDARVSSGQDWFDLEGGVSFGDVTVPFPRLLDAAKQGLFLDLGEGRVGIIPENFASEWGVLDAFSKVEGDALRFAQNQTWILDTLLTSKLDAQVDESFVAHRDKLRRFEGVQPRAAAPDFLGTLRSYQEHALGWFSFLQDFGFGGCLADDMGLGKTVQVLALLQERRSQCEEPSLVVAPRSLVHHWLDEAKRFAPQLRAVAYHGADRRDIEVGEYDLLVTTYGTLRRDVVALAAQQFDYVVLDEAQAIKNATSQASKAARLLSARHRLALTGTPIENHLGDLWALFEFLNPGMLGSARVFDKVVVRSKRGGGLDRAVLSRVLRPFFLRRTKQEVLPDLPEKTEQILHVDLSAEDRQRYDALLTHYRSTLLSDAEVSPEPFHVLEALLRLRQVACHSGLVDKTLRDRGSAKIDALLGHLREAIGAGHKALVFSQFTSLLGIVRDKLEAEGIAFAYLDGQTRKRREAVDRFQNDEACSTFLISLRAGGHGLNLTAADYVFVLDPWWNPAVELQAIDRAHRIGQQRRVFAYRFVARDTVEEKVLDLQRQKRELADALFAEDASLMKGLQREDLELLFG